MKSSAKIWIFFLPEEILRMRVYVFFCVFFRGRFYRPSGPRISQEGSFKWKLQVIITLLSDQKIEGQLGPLPRSFFPKVNGSKF